MRTCRKSGLVATEACHHATSSLRECSRFRGGEGSVEVGPRSASIGRVDGPWIGLRVLLRLAESARALAQGLDARAKTSWFHVNQWHCLMERDGVTIGRGRTNFLAQEHGARGTGQRERRTTNVCRRDASRKPANVHRTVLGFHGLTRRSRRWLCARAEAARHALHDCGFAIAKRVLGTPLDRCAVVLRASCPKRSARAFGSHACVIAEAFVRRSRASGAYDFAVGEAMRAMVLIWPQPAVNGTGARTMGRNRAQARNAIAGLAHFLRIQIPTLMAPPMAVTRASIAFASALVSAPRVYARCVRCRG